MGRILQIFYQSCMEHMITHLVAIYPFGYKPQGQKTKKYLK